MAISLQAVQTSWRQLCRKWDIKSVLGGCVISHIQYALKGQKLLAQGSALGYYRRKLVAL
ncbi:hypothetical protein F7D34_11105 [Prevotella copri]|uniref:Uncharacterized protein n=1 Tax=Segatella copri TaxID=165179 RepID=A0A646HNQ1_9BACT|nr:hypothetical protein [Segatella copri]MQO78493.1 hypothetical protein [Segatella copri]